MYSAASFFLVSFEVLFTSGPGTVGRPPSSPSPSINVYPNGLISISWLVLVSVLSELSDAGASAAISASITMENLGPPTVSVDLSERALELHRQFVPRISKQWLNLQVAL